MRYFSLFLACVLCVMLGMSARASTLVVKSTADTDGSSCGANCTLRQAIKAANARLDADTIVFDPTVFATKQTISLNILPTLGSPITIIGSAAGVTLTNPGRITPTNPNADVMRISGGTINISNINFANTTVGLGIQNNGATLLLSGCTFANNLNGVSLVGGTTTLRNCTFFGNATAIFAGAAYSLDSCTLTGNTAVSGQAGGTLTVKNSIIAGNTTNIVPPFTDGGHNITSGTATAAGLQVDGTGRPVLADNGGPTPTVALANGGAAVNSGQTDLTTDQRGIARPSGVADDIGAFELNNAPRVVSVSPQGASDNVGAKRTFTLVASDSSGASSIREMWLLINTTLSWDNGATLIYVPSASSPTSGLLYLRRGATFLPPIKVGTGASSSAVLDNGAVRVVGTDVKATVAGNAITLTLPLTINNGLVGQNGLFARVQNTAGSVDPAAQPGDSGFVRAGTYTVQPQFSGESNSAPILSRLTPGATTTILSASGISPVAQPFVFAVKDDNGSGDLESVWFLAGKQLNWTGSATFVYQPRTRRLYLRSDDGNSFLGGSVIGSAGILENSQVRVDLSQVKTTIYPDGKTIGLILPLQAKSGLVGQNKVWLRAQDNQGATAANGDAQGYVLSGTWIVTQSPSPGASNTPSASSS